MEPLESHTLNPTPPLIVRGEEHERWPETRTVTPDEQKELDLQSRLEGERIINEQARRQVRTFLDELRNGTRIYRTVASLGDQVAQEYRGRAVLELLQNAHDVLAFAGDRRSGAGSPSS